MITNLGKVALTPRGQWSASIADYEYLDTVTDSGNTYTVLIKTGLVPAGTPLTNTTYYELTAKKGDQGDRAWQPVHANVDDGVRTVQQLVDYVGGTGTKPTANINSYVSTTGYTTVIANAKDIRGSAGLAGASKIPGWVAQVYASGSSVAYLGKYWTSNAATAATDIPGTSAKWVEDLSAYSVNAFVAGSIYNIGQRAISPKNEIVVAIKKTSSTDDTTTIGSFMKQGLVASNIYNIENYYK